MIKKGEIVTSKKRQGTAQRIIKAVGETKGLLTAAAPRAGVSYRTIIRYANEFQAVKKAVIEAKEEMKDFAENQLFKAINEGNLTSIIFYLKTQAKDRGYIEKNDLIQTDVKVNVNTKVNTMVTIPDHIAKRIGDEMAKEVQTNG
jgi:hypothetical protein